MLPLWTRNLLKFWFDLYIKQVFFSTLSRGNHERKSGGFLVSKVPWDRSVESSGWWNKVSLSKSIHTLWRKINVRLCAHDAASRWIEPVNANAEHKPGIASNSMKTISTSCVLAEIHSRTNAQWQSTSVITRFYCTRWILRVDRHSSERVRDRGGTSRARGRFCRRCLRR